MGHRERRKLGFTLVELLVCIAIIALLIAILVPVLAAARERARTEVCASAMRNIGRMIMTMASEHDGRGPGRGYHDQSMPPPYLGGLDLDWCDILNWEIAGQFLADGYKLNALDPHLPPVVLYGRREWENEIMNPNVTYPPGLLMCPNFAPQNFNFSNYSYAYNYDAAGGQGLGPIGSYPPDQYGVLAPPGTAPGGPYYGYSYGANLGRFRPNEFLLVENECQTGETPGRPNLVGTNHTITLSGAFGYPDYSSGGGQFSFRHPYSKMANFLYFDGHVSMLSPKDDINDVRMLSMPGSYPGTE